MLLGFKADLSGISTDIKHLQTSSLSMSLKLSNRHALDTLLTNYLTNIVISPSVARCIQSGPVDARFLHCVSELNKVHSYLSARSPQASALGLVPLDLPSGREVLAHCDKLRLTAVAKLRE